jgi:ABC-2 type transport system ATP-binding protein
MVEIENLSYSYKKKNVFEGLSINFEPGNIYGLLGKNGTGKSTLFRNICGLLKPKKGTITTYGYSSVSRNPSMLSKIFLLPEEFFVPSVYVKDFVGTLAPFYPRFSQEEFQKYITDFEVPIDNRLDQMSMGQKKKTLIAFSLATNTELLLMDEPTNGLDIVSKTQFKNVMAGSVNENKCIIISTHQVKDIENLINRISVIDNGSILFDESISTIGTKISFVSNPVASGSSRSIYAEPNLNGVSEVLINDTGRVSKVDLEMLYKVVMLKTEEINQIFNS